MNEQLIFNLIVPLAIVAILCSGSIVQIGKGFYTGTITYGYKYYGNIQRCNRENNPLGYWFGMILYGSSVAVCVSLGVFIARLYFR